MVLPNSIHCVSAQGHRNHKRYHKLPLCGFVYVREKWVIRRLQGANLIRHWIFSYKPVTTPKVWSTAKIWAIQGKLLTEVVCFIENGIFDLRVL